MTTSNKKDLFWLYHGIGWVVFILFNLLSRGYFFYFHFSELANSLVSGTTLFIVTALLRYPLKKFLAKDSLAKMTLKTLPISVLAALTAQLMYGAVVVPNQQILFGTVIDDIWSQLFLGIPTVWLLVLIWTAIYVVIAKQDSLLKSGKKQNELSTSLKATELDLLMSQINPHFIFNAINNIRALIIEDHEKARSMLASLSDVMRYTMQQNEKLIELQDELSVVKSYLALNQLHFESKLTVQWDIDDETLSFRLPRMMLQLLVENAVKHGIGKLREGGTIKIASTLEKENWIIRVYNSGQLTQNANNSTGIGLKNIKQRLNLIYSGQAALTLKHEKNLVTACIQLPILEL